MEDQTSEGLWGRRMVALGGIGGG